MTHLELGQEYILPNEGEAIATVAQINDKILDKTKKPDVFLRQRARGCSEAWLYLLNTDSQTSIIRLARKKLEHRVLPRSSFILDRLSSSITTSGY